jgi:hypothetical protein
MLAHQPNAVDRQMVKPIMAATKRGSLDLLPFARFSVSWQASMTNPDWNYGAMFSAFPATIFKTLARTAPFVAFRILIVSPCLSYFEQGLLDRSFQ